MSNPCLHRHLSGRDCPRKTADWQGYCVRHRGDVCTECETMLKMFPIRRERDGL